MDTQSFSSSSPSSRTSHNPRKSRSVVLVHFPRGGPRCLCSCRFDKYQMDTHQYHSRPGPAEAEKSLAHIWFGLTGISVEPCGVLNSGINPAPLLLLLRLLLLRIKIQQQPHFPCCALIQFIWNVVFCRCFHTSNYNYSVVGDFIMLRLIPFIQLNFPGIQIIVTNITSKLQSKFCLRCNKVGYN